jgi:hypothetical protein
VKTFKLTLAVAALLAAALLPASALAAGPSHELIRGTDVDTDFCGTGETVDVSMTGVFNGFEDKAFGHISNTWTNPENGASIVDSFSGGGSFVGEIDDGGGAYTLAFARVGMPEQLRLLQGPVLAQDVGRVIFYDHFDANDDYLGTDVVVVGGPHPFLESSTDLFCDLAIEALGL